MIFGKTFFDRAYAKINLYLDVTSRREDGYHNICSVMQTISLSDKISLTLSEEKNDSISCNIDDIPTDERNLAIKALNAFRNETGLNFGAKIHIEKNIPISGGLAGGSSDAAAVIRILSKASEIKLPDDKLIKIATKVGADVPFCLFGGTMLVTGIGDMLKPLPTCPKMYCVIANSGEGVSTPWAYSMLDNKYDNFTICRENSSQSFDFLLKSLENSDIKGVQNNIYNIFEEVIEAERPLVNKIKQIMHSSGAEACLMSGSGPSVFGFFDDEKTASDARDILLKMGIKAFCATT